MIENFPVEQFMLGKCRPYLASSGLIGACLSLLSHETQAAELNNNSNSTSN